MSTVATEDSPSGSVISPKISPENLLFDYPEADVVLRSRDSHEFRVLKLYIVHSSPILGEKLLLPSNAQPEPSASAISVESNVEGTIANAPCVVQLPIEGAILFSLLTYIFPVPPVLPSSVEQTMELLTAAQMYKMDVVLTRIRTHIAQQEPPFIREETAFFIYALSQKHCLRAEALQAARCTLSFSSLTIEDLAEEHKLDVMPGNFLHELWKYHKRVRSNLMSGLEEFRRSNALTILGDSSCNSLIDGLPTWLYGYISHIGTPRVPAILDLSDFYTDLAEHIQYRSSNDGCASCSRLPRTKIRAFWATLTAVVHGSIAKVRVTL
jgi:hypothetical protein